jgi:hypothetical protein
MWRIIFYVPYDLPDGDVFRIEMADAGQVNQGMVAWTKY